VRPDVAIFLLDPGAVLKKAEIVLEPFAGSGTKWVVARKLGRRWTGTSLGSFHRLQQRARDEGTPAGAAREYGEAVLANKVGSHWSFTPGLCG
jgi:hypothetical protein